MLEAFRRLTAPATCVFLTLAFVFAMPVASAASENRANPQLTAEIDGIEAESRESDALIFESFDLVIRSHGSVAEGELTVTIANSGEDELEALFEFQMPTGAVVNGYAIDLENPDEETKGLLIDGVLLEKEKAKQAYENQVRQGIDPGLSNVSRDGVFTTNIYPVNPGETRRMRMRFSFAIGEGLNLPVLLAQKADKWSIRLEMEGVNAVPAIKLPGRMKLKRTGKKIIAMSSGAGSAIDGNIQIAAPKLPGALISKHAGGEGFVHLSGKLPANSQRNKKPGLMQVYWDNSLSHSQGNLEMERQLMEQMAQILAPENIQFVRFNSENVATSTIANAGGLSAELSAVRYGGGSSFAALARRGAKQGGTDTADICLLFFDGVITVDSDAQFSPDCRLHIISSVKAANVPLLAAMARDHGGRFHSLSAADDIPAIIARIARNEPAVQSIRADGGKALSFISLPARNGRWAAIVRSEADKNLNVHFALASGKSRRKIPVRGSARKYDGAAILWASDQLALRENDTDRAAFLAFARKYSVEAPSLSFLVLEEPDDYVRNDIAPPKSYPKGLLAEYREERADADEEEQEEREYHFDDLLRDWDNLKDDWAETYEFPEPGGYERPKKSDADGEADEGNMIVVTGSRIENKVTVSLDAWQPDRPYLKALDRDPEDFETIFLAQQTEYGALPAFYLDVAAWLKTKGHDGRAIEILLSALELPVTNNETRLIVAQRLQRYGQIDRAIELLEYLAAAQPELPQPRRHLALALIQRADMGGQSAKSDYQRAIDLLYNIAINPVERSYRGIDIIALLEANAALPQAAALGVANPMDKRLTALLTSDLRVVVDWTTFSTDLDLWVLEPSGEKAFYGNQETQIGGRVSDDMTNGYGPEEYKIHRAMPGTYEVRVHVFSSDTINPNGVSILTARLIRNFGRPDQSEEYVDIELSGDDDEDRKVGTITVAKPQE